MISSEPDAMTPFQLLQTHGQKENAFLPSAAAKTAVNAAISSFDDGKTVIQKPELHFSFAASFTEVNPCAINAQKFPGGRAPKHIRLDGAVLKKARHFFETDTLLAHKAHGDTLFTAAGVPDRRACSAYPARAPEARATDGQVPEIEVTEADADDNLVTTPFWSAHPLGVAQALLNM